MLIVVPLKTLKHLLKAMFPFLQLLHMMANITSNSKSLINQTSNLMFTQNSVCSTQNSVDFLGWEGQGEIVGGHQ